MKMKNSRKGLNDAWGVPICWLPAKKKQASFNSVKLCIDSCKEIKAFVRNDKSKEHSQI